MSLAASWAELTHELGKANSESRLDDLECVMLGLEISRARYNRLGILPLKAR